MTNTHRKTTNRTTAKIAAVGAFGIGAAIAFPGLAAAQAGDAPDPTASLAEATGEDGSLEGALGTDLNLDLGSLAFNLNLDAEAPTPGSIELGSLGVSPNTGSETIDGGSANGEATDDAGTGSLPGSSEGETQTGAATGEADSGSLNLGSLGSSDETTPDNNVETAALANEGPAESTGSLGSGDDAATDGTDGDEAETGSLSGSLAGLSSETPTDDEAGGTVDVDAGATVNTGSLG